MPCRLGGTLIIATEAKACVRGEQWDVPLFAEHQEVTANRVNGRIIIQEPKRVITLEMSCRWVTNREKKEEEKTTKYGPLRWKLKQKYQGYEVRLI